MPNTIWGMTWRWLLVLLFGFWLIQLLSEHVRDDLNDAKVDTPDNPSLLRHESDELSVRSDIRRSDEFQTSITKAPSRVEASPSRNNQPPAYPLDALKKRDYGTVILRVRVGVDGSASDIDFVQRSGSQALDRAAQQAVRKWTFSPEMRGGVATASSVDVPITFTLPPQ